MPELTWTRYPVDDLLDHITGRFGQTEGYGYAHRGVDVGVAYVPLYAPCDATVSAVYVDGDSSGFGNAIVLDHGMEFDGGPRFSVYAHLSQVFVGLGQMVAAGQKMGRTGNTGKSSGAHLHWQVCLVAWFSVDISYSYDPLAFPLATEGDMADPRLDAVIAALGGMAEIEAWNAKGNSLLRGYALEQQRVGELEGVVSAHITAPPAIGEATGGQPTLDVEATLIAHLESHARNAGVTADDIANAILGGAKFAADGIRFAAQRGSGG